tara:strand:+ start:69 stop:470 length:402 start_codon:yes stop_codon:yes gene_type:complete
MDRREHQGGVPKADRSNEQWVSTCDFPYEVLPEFKNEEEELYPMEKFTDALNKIALWILNDGKFQNRGIADRAMVFAFMMCPHATGCSTQAELAQKMKLSRSQVNEYVKQFTERFNFVSGVTYSERQRRSRAR